MSRVPCPVSCVLSVPFLPFPFLSVPFLSVPSFSIPFRSLPFLSSPFLSFPFLSFLFLSGDQQDVQTLRPTLETQKRKDMAHAKAMRIGHTAATWAHAVFLTRCPSSRFPRDEAPSLDGHEALWSVYSVLCLQGLYLEFRPRAAARMLEATVQGADPSTPRGCHLGEGEEEDGGGEEEDDEEGRLSSWRVILEGRGNVVPTSCLANITKPPSPGTARLGRGNSVVGPSSGNACRGLGNNDVHFMCLAPVMAQALPGLELSQ